MSDDFDPRIDRSDPAQAAAEDRWLAQRRLDHQLNHAANTRSGSAPEPFGTHDAGPAFPGIDELELRPTPAQVKAGKIRIDQCGHCGLLVSAPTTRGHGADTKLGPCPRCQCPSWWRQCSDVTEVEPGRHIVGPFYRSAT